jgi:hypothetical protein
MDSSARQNNSGIKGGSKRTSFARRIAPTADG